MDGMRRIISTHGPNLNKDHFFEIMYVTDLWVRITELDHSQSIPPATAPPIGKYAGYFQGLRELEWLELDSPSRSRFWTRVLPKLSC